MIGATGGVDSRTAAQLVERGDHVPGLHRRTGQSRALRERGIEPVAGDLTSISADELAGRVRSADTIVFAAGAPDSGTAAADAVDGHGVVVATAAAVRAGVWRFIHISAFPDAWRDRRMPADFEHYMKVKREADVHIASTDLDWAIVRPGTLTDEPATGRVRLGLAIPYGEVPRDDVAGVLAELVHAPEVRHLILELTCGETPIREALSRTVRETQGDLP